MNKSSIPRPQCRKASFRKKSASFVLALIALFCANATVAFAANGTVDITGKTIANINSEIQTALGNCSPGETVTVTGTLSVSFGSLVLNIAAGKTVVWRAELTSSEYDTLVLIQGRGTLDVQTGGLLKTTNSYYTVGVQDYATVKVSGGTVENTDYSTHAVTAIGLNSGTKAEVTAGEVKAARDGIFCLGAAIVNVTGGTVSSGAKSGIFCNANNAIINVTGGKVSTTSSDAAAINLSTKNVTLTIGDDAVVTGRSSISIGSGTTSVVNIVGGTITGPINANSGTVHISGGAVANGTGNALNLLEASVAVVTGGAITGNSATPIDGSSGHTGAAYYTGDRAGLFNTTYLTAGTNLFKLDAAPALTTSGVDYTYDAGTGATNPVVATLSDKLDLTNATVTASAGNPAVDNGARTATFGSTINSAAITLTITGAKITGTNIVIPDFTTASFGVNTDLPGLSVNGSTPYTTVSAARTAITNALTSGDVTVTGKLTGVTTILVLEIPTDRTVTWQAEFTGTERLVNIYGGGIFDIVSGSLIKTSNYYTVVVGDNTTVKVSGGTVENTNSSNGRAIWIAKSGAKAEVTSGEVKAYNNGIECDDDNTAVSVTGGTVSSSTRSAITSYYGTTVTIGGTANITAATNSIYISKANATVSIGENASVTGYITANGGIVHISGGTVMHSTNNALTLFGSSTALITGGTITGNTATPIIRNSEHTGAAYYIGDYGSKFNMTNFTAGTDLFKLDAAPALTANGAAYSGDATSYDVVATLPSVLDLTDATVTTSAGSPTVDKTANTVTFNSDINNDALTITVSGAKIGTIAVPDFTTAAFGVNIDLSGLSVNDSGLYTTVADIKSAIETALASGDVTVTGTLAGVTSTLTLTIPTGRTVVWKAELTGSAETMVKISGGGTLDVQTGGFLKTSDFHATIDVGENTTVKVSGGKVENTDASGSAIFLDGTDAKAEVTSGEVTGRSHGIGNSSSCLISAISLTGGTVSATGDNGIAISLYNNTTATISGNAIVTGGMYSIFIENSSTSSVNISGGTLTGLFHVRSGTILITGGLIENNTINRDGNGTAYYTGNYGSKFSSNFTLGTNLFQLDGVPALTANGAAYSGEATGYDVVATLPAGLDLTDATVTASAGSPTLNSTANTVTFSTVINATDVTLTVSGAKIGTITVPDFTTAAFAVKIIDATAPVLSSGNVNRTSDTEATIDFTTDEAGTAYYLVVNSGATAPSSAEVKDETSLGSVTAGAVTGKAVTLTAGAKDIYVVVQDAAGNISDPLKIEAAIFPVYSISLDANETHTFPAAQAGYGAQTPLSVTVTNTGNQATGDLTVALSGTNANAFNLSETTVSSIAAGGTGSFTVSPKTGLAAATYTATVTVSGSNSITATFNVSFTVNMPAYGISIGALSNGTVTANPANTTEGEQVTLTIAPESNYELDAISAYKTGDETTTVTLTGSGNTRTFTMPDYGVTVTATFKKTADLVAVETAKSLIEDVTYTVDQATANTEATVKTWLASQINNLSGMGATDITVTASMITFSDFTDATAGTESSTAGANGSFTFTVALSKGSVNLATSSITGTITATPYITYSVTINTAPHGTVTASTASAPAGETVTLTIDPAAGYELETISAHKTGDEATTVTLTGSDDTRTFTMPSYGVTVKATFKKTADQEAVEAAKALIENAVFAVAQAAANTEAYVKAWLVGQINSLISGTGVSISLDNVTVSSFNGATAGSASNYSGSNGSFSFSVSLSSGGSSETASASGTIAATTYTPPATYAVTIAATSGGTVSANPTVTTEGAMVTVTIVPASGYELETISAYRTGSPSTTVALTGNGNIRTFTMPAYGVTVSATFRKTQAQLDKEAVEAAKTAIEGGTYQVAQATANDAASIKTWLVNTLNTLFGQSHDMQLRSATSIDGDVTVTAIMPATAGTESNPSGVNGAFTFTVTLNRGASNATATFTGGVIIATPYSSITGIEDVPQPAKLYAVSTGSGLQVHGLVQGEVFSIYNISGQLQFKGKATAPEQLVPLRERGVYIVVSGNRRVKTVY